MKLLHYTVGVVQTNCYFLVNEETSQVLIVDPGASGAQLANAIKEAGLTPAAVLLTHGHFDHVMGLSGLQSCFDTPIPVFLLDIEKKTLEDPQLNASWIIHRTLTFSADHYVSDNEILTLAGFEIHVLSTPGHTIGGCCYYLPAESLVLTGDTLFAGSVGRTDFELGSHEDLIQSIRTRLLPLPEETIVLPGHGGFSTIGQEKAGNPYI